MWLSGISISAELSDCILKFSAGYSAGTLVSAYLTTGSFGSKGIKLIFLFL